MKRDKKEAVDMNRIPEHTISRLSLYLRGLTRLAEDGVETVSSEALATRFGLNAAQIRKDLAYFGEFGVRGVGYNVIDLRDHLQRIMGLDRVWHVALFGLGNLGRALLSYRGFSHAGFTVKAIFDVSPAVVGLGEVQQIPIFSISDAPHIIHQEEIEIAILCVPSEAAHTVADIAVEAGITAILNFAPVSLKLPDHIKLRNVDLTVNLENLSFFLHSPQG